MGFLTDLIGDLRRRLERDPLDESGLLAIAMHLPPPRPFEDALRGTPPVLIGEYKRSSPSAGGLAERDPPAQVIESRAAGGDAVLLIAAALSELELKGMLSVAADLGLNALVETHSEDDLAKALATDAPVIGVNARDLETLDVDLARALAMLDRK